MGEFIQTLFNQLKEFFSKIERKKLIRIGVLVVLILAVIIVSLSLLNRKTYTVLFSELDPKEAGTILNNLKERGVDAKPGSNNAILVPEEQADELRLQLAAENVPQVGLNYDVWSLASAIGTTEAEKRVYYQYQLQENLRATISKINGVRSCVVFVNLAENSALRMDMNREHSTASILLDLDAGVNFTKEQIAALTNLVVKSVKDLSNDNVSITDTSGRDYMALEDEETTARPDHSMIEQLELQTRVRDQLHDQVINLLSPVFGPENVSAEIAVTLNFDTRTSESVKFEPPVPDSTTGLAISLKELDETIKGSSAAAQEAAGFDPNGAAPQYPAVSDGSGNDDTLYNKVTRETNMEINETKSQIDSAKGQIENLTVGVAINRNVGEEDFSDDVRSIVASAMGVDERNVAVRRLPFQNAEPPLTNAEIASRIAERQAAEQSAQQLVNTLIMAGTIIVVAVLVLIMVLSLRKKPEPVPELAAAMAGAEGMDGMVGMDGSTFDVMVGDEDEVDENGVVISSRKSNTRELVEEYIRRDPESVAHLLRNWLSSEVR